MENGRKSGPLMARFRGAICSVILVRFWYGFGTILHRLTPKTANIRESNSEKSLDIQRLANACKTTHNVTFLIGAEDGDVPTVKKIIDEYSNTHRHTAHTTGSYGIGLAAGNLPEDATVPVGGATVFVLGVDSMEKY